MSYVVHQRYGQDFEGVPFGVGGAEEVREELGDRRGVAHLRQAAQVVGAQLAEPAGYVCRRDFGAAQLVGEICANGFTVVHGYRQDE